MSKNLYKIEKCINAKKAFMDKWETGRNYYTYPKIQEEEKINLIEPIHNLASSMYYTFSKVKYEMGCISFTMFLHTRNSKYTVTQKPFKIISSLYDEKPLREFTDALYKIYPSKRPASCVIYITHPSFTLENSNLAGRPYFPCNFIGGRLPMLNSIKTFNTEVCQICNENPASILFCVCGHICVCGECIKKYESSACSICKTYNEYVRKIILKKIYVI